jgi:predicted nucleotidyltransferase
VTRLEAANSIEKLTEQLISKYHPEKIILFGSAVRDFEAVNDIDLFIVKNDVPHFGAERIQQLYRLVASDTAVDYIVYRPSEVAARLLMGDPFVTGIFRDGKVLYG